MWHENYESYHLLFADEGKLLFNMQTGQHEKKARCSPGEVKRWREVDAQTSGGGTSPLL